ncbi:MAG: hypothetical protein GY711_12290 [bacterium]|nr:hypothetical protein [bacterium]
MTQLRLTGCLTGLLTGLLTCLALAGFATSASRPQDPVTSMEFFQPPYHSPSDLVMQRYQPTRMGASELFPVASAFLGHDIYLRNPTGGKTIQQPNMQQLGNAILIYDLPAAIEPAIEMLKKLDESYETQTQPPRVVTEYAARFVSIDALHDALQPYRQNSRRGSSTVTRVDERRVLVLHDTQERVDEMLGFLKKMDVEPTQIQLSCYLVRGTDEPIDGPKLPKELIEGMRELAGTPNLERAAMGLVRTVVGPGGQLTIVLETSRSGTFQLSMRPGNFDRQTRTLSADRCSLTAQTGTSYSQGTVLFQTDANVTSGEYTVLGAAGANPLFVVLRCQVL